MNIYYEHGCFSIWDVSALEKMPKATVRKITRLLWNNRTRSENEECVSIFCKWLDEKLDYFKRKCADNAQDKAAEKQLKFYTSIEKVIL